MIKSHPAPAKRNETARKIFSKLAGFWGRRARVEKIPLEGTAHFSAALRRPSPPMPYKHKKRLGDRNDLQDAFGGHNGPVQYGTT